MAATVGHAQSIDELMGMSLEQLGRIKVTSVSGHAQSLSQTPASLYVITADDIRRSSATTLAEALRLAPNLIVSRLDAGTYAISARGFNSNIANKLLVLVDGRTIYSPLFSGVFWEANDVMLEDVDRIEVMSGPAGSQWGTNAVNGVINVITKSSADTQGQLASAQLGKRESAAAYRYGGRMANDGTFRVYGKSSDTHDFTRFEGSGAASTWRRQQAGFRTDWSSGGSDFTVQGDAVNGASATRAAANAGETQISGLDILGRWTRRLGDGSQFRLQSYYEQANHRDNLLLDENGEVFDVEGRHLLAAAGRHRMQWGAGYRYAKDRSDPGTLFAFIPANASLNWSNLYAQDEIRLADALTLTAGARMERDSYTGWEFLPNLRLGWSVAPDHFLWTGLSRAVRSPSRVDRAIFTPPRPPFIVAGGPNFTSEIAKVFEVGYRGQPTRALSYSVTFFNQDYSDLKSAELTPGSVFPVTSQNKTEGTVSGVETWGYWQVLPDWRLMAGYTNISARLHLVPGSTDPVGPGNLGNNPADQWMLRSTLNIDPRQECDAGVRRVGSLPPYPGNAMPVPAYTAVDLRYAVRVDRRLELSVVAQNAFDPYHREWGDRTSGSELGRAIFFKAVWRR
jgi:iron complex outermembrane receptor protein